METLDWVIIDGYSLLHALEPEPRLGGHEGTATRHRFLRTIEASACRLAPRATVVFDGQAGEWAPRHPTDPLEVYFSASGQTADAVIERWVATHEAPARILVVSSDRHELDAVAAGGAQTMSCPRFLDQCRADRHHFQRTQRRVQRGGGPRLGDYFPEPG